MYEDLGKYKHSKKKEDVGSFRTPSLREVARTAPYMHNGFMPDLEGIVEMYNIGMPRPEPRENQKKDTLFPTTDRLLQPLNLSRKEKEALVAFLKTLSSPAYHERMPELPQ
jgi:cytochrome c551 peroxidase